jgi:hypothetical protein
VAREVKSSNGFGILALASVCPIVTVLMTGLCIRLYQWKIGEIDPEAEEQAVINGNFPSLLHLFADFIQIFYFLCLFYVLRFRVLIS